MEVIKNYFTTSDKVRLFYRVSGDGFPLVILNGMGQTIESFEKNYPDLDRHFRVYCFDYRFHGQSETPDYGYHIERFAQDFEEFRAHMGLERFHVLGHSMGNAVFWSYIMLYGQSRVEKYILDEEAPCLLRAPDWSEEEKLKYTGLWTQTDLFETMPGMLHPNMTLRDVMMVRLFRDHISRDWRDIVAQIRIPTLIFMGGKSHFASPFLWQWLQDTIVGSEFALIGADEGGSHGMHIENPEKFDQEVIRFLNGSF
jgi:pimeloyl-ACP methyl ester carboxylesterase